MPAEKHLPDAGEYLEMERASKTRHEFVQGEIYAMSGASRKHNLINGNLFAALHGQLKKRPCEIYTCDMRVKIRAGGDYVYPDIAAVCGEPRFEDKELDTLLNPTLIVEVLSKTTKIHDRGDKFTAYRTLESLREYLLITQDEVHVEHYVKQNDGRWLLSETICLQDSLALPAIGCTLELADV
ncbi:MAG: Uma2 family endonuclease [Gammaproteobacteria bacterium]|nr:Uma2 family endonuclease [Gammaproteobacteria bacterium]